VFLGYDMFESAFMCWFRCRRLSVGCLKVLQKRQGSVHCQDPAGGMYRQGCDLRQLNLMVSIVILCGRAYIARSIDAASQNIL
jgi:hypothetical protein